VDARPEPARGPAEPRPEVPRIHPRRLRPCGHDGAGESVMKGGGCRGDLTVRGGAVASEHVRDGAPSGASGQPIRWSWSRRDFRSAMRRSSLRPEKNEPRAVGPGVLVEAIGCGGRIRTADLRVMSPTSCRCSTPRLRMVWGVSTAVKSPRLWPGVRRGRWGRGWRTAGEDVEIGGAEFGSRLDGAALAPLVERRHELPLLG
jgi:hypothetical protein